MKEEERENWAAPCGLYCGACSIRLAYKRGDSNLLNQIAEVLSVQQGQKVQAKDLACEGCLSPEVVAVVCRNCVLRACALEKGVVQCSQCPDFPCKQLVDFSKDGLPHHGEVLENIRRRQEIGIDVWTEEQRKRWCCPYCGCNIDWYAAQCPNCGAALTPQFNPPDISGQS